MATKLLALVVQVLMSLLAVLALMLALSLADGSPLPALAAIAVCCWAVQKGHSATIRRRHRGKHA